MKKPILAITMGDPAGIGSEITVKVLQDPKLYETAVPVVFGDAGQLRRLCGITGIKADVVPLSSAAEAREAAPSPSKILVVDLHNIPDDVEFGKVQAQCGKAAYEYIAAAIRAALAHEVQACVTAPLNKEALHLGGCPFPGHTEIFANLTHTKDYSMMLVGEKLRVIHVSTHISLRKACDAVKKDRVLKVIKLADEALRMMGIDNPRIAVAGLNPHCGEGGLFGDEDVKEIVPAVEEAKAKGLNVQGPIAPDTVFHRAANKGEFDIVVVMYHDQGHIPLKVLGFSSGVNITVGLPVIRTSVDHGTAFEIAGKGIANPESMTVALNIAAKMANVRFASELKD
jgi:4-hydroxythreonine-4-phosphate dehydrogenase